MESIFFVRHGLSVANRQHVVAGILDSPLTAEGHDQARRTGMRLAQEGVIPDVMIASPLSRAYETAKEIAKAVGYPVSDIVLEPLLVERSFGVLEGVAGAPLFEHYSYEEICSSEGVESLTALATRAHAVWELAQRRPQGCVMLVGHGAFARSLRRVIRGDDEEAELSDPWTLANAQVAVLWRDGALGPDVAPTLADDELAV